MKEGVHREDIGRGIMAQGSKKLKKYVLYDETWKDKEGKNKGFKK